MWINREVVQNIMFQYPLSFSFSPPPVLILARFSSIVFCTLLHLSFKPCLWGKTRRQACKNCERIVYLTVLCTLCSHIFKNNPGGAEPILSQDWMFCQIVTSTALSSALPHTDLQQFPFLWSTQRLHNTSSDWTRESFKQGRNISDLWKKFCCARVSLLCRTELDCAIADEVHHGLVLCTDWTAKSSQVPYEMMIECATSQTSRYWALTLYCNMLLESEWKAKLFFWFVPLVQVSLTFISAELMCSVNDPVESGLDRHCSAQRAAPEFND